MCTLISIFTTHANIKAFYFMPTFTAYAVIVSIFNQKMYDNTTYDNAGKIQT